MSKKRKYDIVILFDCIFSGYDETILIPKIVVEGNLDENFFIAKDETGYPKAEDALFNEITQCFGFPITLETKINGKKLEDYTDKEVQTIMSDYMSAVHKYLYTICIDHDYKVMTYKTDINRLEMASIDIDDDLYTAIAKQKVVAKSVKNIKEQFNDENTHEERPLLDANPEYKEEATAKQQTSAKLINIENIYKKMTKHVLFQDNQIKKILTAVYKNQLIDDPKLKTNILLTGPTGVGKTEIIRLLNKELNLPVVIEDATQYTIAGYVGKSIEEMLLHLYENANRDLFLAERGVLFIDEIDKKANPTGQKDSVAGTGVLYSLLKLMEDGSYMINTKNGPVNFNTPKLTIIVAGAFSELKDLKEKTIGFNHEINNNDAKININNETLIQYGIPPEFIGRCQLKVNLNSLGIGELREILVRSKSSHLVLNRQFFSSHGIKLEYHKTIDEIASKAFKLGTGARSLNSIVDETLSEATYEILANPRKYARLTITNETVQNPKIYKLTEKGN